MFVVKRNFVYLEQTENISLKQVIRGRKQSATKWNVLLKAIGLQLFISERIFFLSCMEQNSKNAKKKKKKKKKKTKKKNLSVRKVLNSCGEWNQNAENEASIFKEKS